MNKVIAYVFVHINNALYFQQVDYINRCIAFSCAFYVFNHTISTAMNMSEKLT